MGKTPVSPYGVNRDKPKETGVLRLISPNLYTKEGKIRLFPPVALFGRSLNHGFNLYNDGFIFSTICPLVNYL